MASGLGRGGLQGLVVALIFFGPLLAAFLLYGPANYRPAGSVAHGTLLEPGQVVPNDEIAPQGLGTTPMFRDIWTLTYFKPNGCDQACEGELQVLTTVWQRLAKDQVRVQRVLIIGPTPSSEPVGDFHVLTLDKESALSRFFLELGGDEEPLFVTDPLGNAVLRYPGDVEPAGLLEDIERLLDLSRIG